MKFVRHYNKFTYLENVLFIAIWVIVFIIPVFFRQNNETISIQNLFIHWRRLIPFVIISLVNHFVLVPFLYFKSRKILYVICALFMVIGISVIIKSIDPMRLKQRNHAADIPAYYENKNLPGTGLPRRPEPQFRRLHPVQNNRPASVGGIPVFLNMTLILISIIGFDTGLRTVFRLSQKEFENNVLEKESIKNELAFLRNQVSPHFLMNTLNNIHALIDLDAEKAKETIIRLSKLMRYLLYDTNQKKIPLSEEINFISSYVELMKMRMDDNSDITVNYNIEDTEKKIPPMLFTSLIENAFKYGINYRDSSYINIRLSTKENNLTFISSNNYIKSEKEKRYSGIGMENTRKRLNILFGDNYNMTIDDNDNIYTVTVTLKLPL